MMEGIVYYSLILASSAKAVICNYQCACVLLFIEVPLPLKKCVYNVSLSKNCVFIVKDMVYVTPFVRDAPLLDCAHIASQRTSAGVVLISER
jgi:hypothetical protein